MFIQIFVTMYLKIFNYVQFNIYNRFYSSLLFVKKCFCREEDVMREKIELLMYGEVEVFTPIVEVGILILDQDGMILEYCEN